MPTACASPPSTPPATSWPHACTTRWAAASCSATRWQRTAAGSWPWRRTPPCCRCPSTAAPSCSTSPCAKAAASPRSCAANERHWRSDAEIDAGLLKIWQVMQDCVRRGCATEGTLPGGFKVKRRAHRLYRDLISHPEAALARPAAGAGLGEPLRAGGERGERRRRPRGHRAHQRRGRHRAGGAALLRALRPRRHRCRRHRLPAHRRGDRPALQGERQHLRRRGRLPGRGRRGLLAWRPVRWPR